MWNRVGNDNNTDVSLLGNEQFNFVAFVELFFNFRVFRELLKQYLKIKYAVAWLGENF